jgi:hypothetical protein
MDGDQPSEPHFVVGVMKGLHLMLQGLGNKLTPQYYERLHDTCIEGDSANAINQSTDSSIQEGEFGKFLVDNTSTFLKSGYRSLEQVQTEHGPAYRVSGYSIPPRGWYSNAGFRELCQNYNHRDGGDPRYGANGHPVGKALMGEPIKIIKDKYIAFKFLEKEECKAHAKSIFDKYYEEIRRIRAPILFNHNVKQWSHNLVSSLSEQEIQEVLTPIAHCCRDLSLSHLFWDANGRVNGFIVLPKLLIENGLLPPIMKSDPYTLDRCGIQEIVTAIREGQQLFKERCLIPERSKKN